MLHQSSPLLACMTELMSTRPHVQEARERFKKISEGHFVWFVVFLQCSEIESDCFEVFQSQFGNPPISPSSSAPHFLLARLQGYSFQFVFQLVLPAYTLHLPSICVLPTAFKTFCSNKLGILTGRSWHFSDISRLITPVAPNFRQKSWNQYNCPLHAGK